jgi:hypothetical protein
MKLVGAISTAVLSLSLGVGIPAYAQQEQHDQQENKDKPAQEKEKKAQPEKGTQQDKNKAQEGKNAQQREKNAKPEEKNTQQQHAQSTQHGGSRIPDDRYRANFGRGHTFHVSESNYRDRRFQYGGYWFGFDGVWPSNWLYTQDVFVVEIDGVYYLCNASYPGVNIALSVTL